MKQQQIKEQYELLNLIKVETTENRKLPRQLDRELLQFNASFTIFFQRKSSVNW